jgi:glycosidase
MTRTIALMVALGWAVLGLPMGVSRAADYFPTPRGHLGNDVLYYVVVDRFFDGDPNNNIPLDAFPVEGDLDPATLAYNQANRALLPHGYDPSHRYIGLYWGGDLAGVLAKLDYLQELGVTKLVLSSIQDSAAGLLYDPGFEGFLYSQVQDTGENINDFYRHLNAGFNSSWTKDWFEIEEHFQDNQGGDDRFGLFRQLLNEAGDRGIGIILELNLNHTSPYRTSLTYDPFDPARSERWLVDQGGIYRHGLKVADYAQLNNGEINPQGWFHDPIALDYNRPTPTMLEQAPIQGLPDLNPENPQVEAYLLDALQFWLTLNPGGYPVAGFYLPAIVNSSLQFWQKLEQTVQNINPDTVLLAAYGDGGYRKLDSIDWYEKTQNYSLINYSFSIALRRFFGRDRGWDGRTAVLREMALGKEGKYYNYGLASRILHWILNPSASLEVPRHALDVVNPMDAKGWVNFVDAPDQTRLLSYYPHMTRQAYASALKFMFASEGVPLVMYGAETGLSVPHHFKHSSVFGVGGDPFNQQMMIWPGDEGWNDNLYQLMQNLGKLRQDHLVLRYGDTTFLYPQGSRSDRDLFMVRQFKSCDFLPETCDRSDVILYAYSTEGGDFLVNFPDQEIRAMQDVDAQQVYPVVKGLIPIKLKPEEAKILVLKPRRTPTTLEPSLTLP